MMSKAFLLCILSWEVYIQLEIYKAAEDMWAFFPSNYGRIIFFYIYFLICSVLALHMNYIIAFKSAVYYEKSVETTLLSMFG